MPALRHRHIDDEGVKRALLRAVAGAESHQTHRLPRGNQRISVFFSRERPAIDPQDYAKRVHKYASKSNEIHICALILLERLKDKNSMFTINAYNMNRLLITAVMVAAKNNLEAGYYSYGYYCRVGGIQEESEIVRLETDMIAFLDGEVHEEDEEIHAYYARNSY